MDFDAAEFLLGYMADQYVSAAFEAWDAASGSFNAGQQSIYWTYVMPNLEAWAEDAYFNFPEVDPGEYEDAMYYAYDDEVMDRAFSDTIETPVPEMDELAGRGQELQIAMELAEIFDF